MNKHFLQGEHVMLRAIEPEDLDFLYQIENDPELWDIGNLSVPYSKYVLKQYIANNQYDIFADRQLRLIIQQNHTGLLCGTIDISDYFIPHARAEVGIALLGEYRNRGIGQEALMLLCDYAFNFLHFHQLYAHVQADNQASLALFTSCRFYQSGLLKQWLHVNDSWIDVQLLQSIATDKIPE